MSKIQNVMQKYTVGEATLEETNEALAALDAGFHLTPGKNALTEDEMRETTVGHYPDQANGWGLLDTGTGSLDKAHVVNGKFAEKINTVMPDGKANMVTYFIICGKTYQVLGDTLADM